MSSQPAAVTELARWSSESPETPFLFFRGPRGHFTWWSVARAAEEAGKDAGPDQDPSIGVPHELLAALVGADQEAWLRAAALARPDAGERPIWISYRPLTDARESALALAGLVGRWAVVREPSDRLSPDLIAWARPTLLSGRSETLLELAAGFERLAPRFRAAAWRRRRLARLRTVWVEDGTDPRPAAERFAALGARAVVLSFPSGGW